MTRRDRKPAKGRETSTVSPSLGDLLGNPEWKALWELERRRQAEELEQAARSAKARQAAWAEDQARWMEELRPWAHKEKGLPIEELLQQQPYVTLIGLARLADTDPAEVILRYEKGDVPAKVIRAVLGIGRRKSGPKDNRVNAERWRVVHELENLGYTGPALDAAINDVAGHSVTIDHYRRCATRYKGDKSEALRMVSDAIEKARGYPPFGRKRGA